MQADFSSKVDLAKRFGVTTQTITACLEYKGPYAVDMSEDSTSMDDIIQEMEGPEQPPEASPVTEYKGYTFYTNNEGVELE
jgi:hypothetical protein